MNRRKFLGLLGKSALALAVPIPKEIIHFVPNAAQIKFLETPLEIPMVLWGLPYHQSNASTSQWLGITRKELLRSSQSSR